MAGAARQIVAARIPYLMPALYRQQARLAPSRPLLVATTRTIRACCEICARRGVLPQMTVRQAQTLVPDAALTQPDALLEAEGVGDLLEMLAREITPLIEFSTGDYAKCVYPDQAGVFYLDLEQLNHRDTLRVMARLAALLADTLNGNTVQVGLGGSKFTAYAATYPQGDVMAALPIRLLPLDDPFYERLMLLGLTTLGAFAALPADAVYRQFGKYGLFVRQLAAGFDLRPVRPFKPQIVERVAYTSEVPIREQAIFEAILAALSAELSARLQKRGCMGRTFHLMLALADGKRRERQLTMRREISGAIFIEKALRLLSDTFIAQGGDICAVTVTLTDIVPFAGYQLDLFDHHGENWTRLTQAVEKLAARYGREPFTRPVEVDPYARLIERRYEFQPFLIL
jgi:protein ImuB